MSYWFLPRSFAGAAMYGGDFVGCSQAHMQAHCSFLLYSPFHAHPELPGHLQSSGHFSVSSIYPLNIVDGIILTATNLCCFPFALHYSPTPVVPCTCIHPYKPITVFSAAVLTSCKALLLPLHEGLLCVHYQKTNREWSSRHWVKQSWLWGSLEVMLCNLNLILT